MARRNPPAKWALPEVVDPVVRRCIQVEVPDDPAHIAAFRGAMLSLASAYNWADDIAHTAKDVAAVWRDINDNLTEWGCGGVQTILRADPMGCGIQWSLDNGDTWSTIDLTGCIATIWDEKLAGAFDDGVLGKGVTQQGPMAPPASLTCRTYHVKLGATSKWICPSNLAAGDTVRITNATGGWNDGTVVWYCPDGSPYAFGLCGVPEAGHLVGTDPLPTVNHMKIVGNYATTWIDPMTALYTMPDLTPSQPFYLQPNDASLADNAGEVEFDVEICSHEAMAGCYFYDFTTGQHGFSLAQTPPGFGPYGDYAGALGWLHEAYADGQYLTIVQDTSAGAFHELNIQIEVENPDTIAHTYVLNIWNGSTLLLGHSDVVDPGIHIIDYPGSGISFPDIPLQIEPHWVGTLGYTRKIFFQNCDAQPYGSENCP